MKFLILSLLFMNFAFAQGAPKKKTDHAVTIRASEAQNERLEQKREDRRERQEEEARVNDDFDPELDAIDDDLTTDEGIEDE